MGLEEDLKRYKIIADGLRIRQINKGYHTKEVLDEIEDKVIITSYLICCNCQAYLYSNKEIDFVMKVARNSDEFIAMLDKIDLKKQKHKHI